MATLSNFATNVIVPQPHILKAATQAIVREAAEGGHVQRLGFSAHAARAAIDVILESPRVSPSNTKEEEQKRIQLQCSSPQILASFPRGVEIAMVEHLVAQSNRRAKAMLQESEDAAFAQDTGFVRSSMQQQEPHHEAASKTSIELRSMREVCYVALHAKLTVLQPFVLHWSHAIALESKVENVPHALYNLSEFCDEVNYYGERVEARKVIKHESSSSSPFGATTSTTPPQQAGGVVVPLNAGPQTLGLQWYWNRAKVAPLYGTTMLHMMGDSSKDYKDSYEFLRWSVNQAF